MKKFYITTAIPYVNGAPHIGFAMELIQTDIIARYHRLKGDDTYFLTGVDENSLKNVQSAEKEGITTQELCDKNSAKFQLTADVLDISNNDFIRTTEKRHIKGAQKFWVACKKEYIYKKKYKGLYCVGCEMFYSEDELIGGLCPEHKKALDTVEEENYFFKLSNYQKKLDQLIESDELKIVPQSRKNEVLSFIRDGLEDFSISRSVERAKDWGVSVPGDESQVMYVWFDALSNYITALDYLDNGDKFKKYWPADVHAIGKGIIRFHAIYWPAMLMSAGLPLPKKLFVHGYITVDGQKISKSLGNVVDPNDLVSKYGSDVVRYFLSREISPCADGDFSVKRLEERYVSDLQNGLGNLVSRVFALASKEQFLPLDFQVENEEKVGSEIQAQVKKTWSKYELALENFAFNDALAAVWELIAYCDGVITSTKLWTLIDNDQEEFVKIMYNLLETLRHIAWMVQPFMPQTSLRIIERLFVDEGNEKRELNAGLGEIKKWGGLQPKEIRVEKGGVLFPRLGE